MPRYAIVKDGVVLNIVISSHEFISHLLDETSTAHLIDDVTQTVSNGWLFNYETGEWSPPKPTYETLVEEAIVRIKDGYLSTIMNGVTPMGCDFALRADEYGQQRAARFLTLLRETEQVLPEDQREAYKQSMVGFDDIVGNIKLMTVVQWREAIVSFGQQVLKIEATLANLLVQARTLPEEELPSLGWPNP